MGDEIDRSQEEAVDTTSREVPAALAWELISKILVSILGIVSNVMIVRGLGDHDYGLYSVFLNICRFFAIIIYIGPTQIILRFLPETKVKGNILGGRQLIWSSLIMQMIAWIVVCVGVYFMRDWIGSFFDDGVRDILLLGCILLIFETFWQVVNQIYRAYRWMRLLTVISSVQRVVLIVLLAIFALDGLTIPKVLYAVAGSFLLGFCSLLPNVIRRLSWRGAVVGKQIDSRRLFKYAMPIILIGLINQILWRSSETLIISHYHSVEDGGYFNAAYNLPQMILEFIPMAIWPIILASLSEVHALRSSSLIKGIHLYFRLICVLVIPLSVVGFILGGNAYLMLYEEAMAPGAPICQMFFPIFMVSFLINPLRMAIYIKERTMLNMWAIGVGAIVNLGLDFLLIPRYGLMGAVPPVGIAILVSGYTQWLISRRLIPEISLPWSYLLKFIPGVLLVTPLWFVRDKLTEPIPLLTALALATMSQYVVLRLFRACGEDERNLVLKSNLPMKRFIADLIAPTPGQQ